MFELARSPAVHARCRVRLGAGGLSHELGGGRWSCRRAWFGFEVVLEVLVEALEAWWVVLVAVVYWFPRLSEESMGLIDVGGVSVVGSVVVN